MVKKKNSLFKNISMGLLVLVVLALAFSMFSGSFDSPEKISISQLADEVKAGQVKEVEVREDNLKVILHNNEEQESIKEGGISLAENLEKLDVSATQIDSIEIKAETQSGWDFFLRDILPMAIMTLVVLGFFFWFMFRAVQGSQNKAMSFGQSGARKSENNGPHRITFKDVAGSKEAKVELYEIVEFLKSPAKFLKLGAKIPKGVLLLGAPGTGKTLMARAVAGEAGVPFFHISGSEFVEMFVGVGASRVRDLFKHAKKEAPSIVFVDEIDAVGRQRGTGLGGSHDEREQTLNQILVEMDGFDQNTNVIVMAATNRPDVLDPALLRPGRFDRRVTLDLPDIEERQAILRVHSRKKPIGKNVSLKILAQRTPGFSGADLENLLNEAAISAARADRQIINMKDCTEAIEKVMLGPERKSHILSKEEKKVTAYHEGGHALISHILPKADPVHKVSIISRGRAAGYTMNLPDKDKRLHTKSEFLDDLAVYLGGYTAEKMIFGDISTGASNDLQRATKLARQLVTEFGMSDKLGPVTFGVPDEWVFLGKELGEHRDYGEKVQTQIDEEVSRFVREAQARAEKVLIEHRAFLDKIANKLVEEETLEKEEFENIFKVIDSEKEEKKAELPVVKEKKD